MQECENVNKVVIGSPAGHATGDHPVEPVPEWLNWDLWQGPAQPMGYRPIITGQIPDNDLLQYEFAGELALSGHLRAIHGALPMALHTKKAQRVLAIPLDNPDDLQHKRFLERFGFREVGKGVMKRNAGSVTPPSVPTARL